MTKQPQIKRVRRPIDGILLLDKPQGMTSNYALQRVKHLFNAEKAGHTGSLDPLATGLLPICLGEATKYSQHLLDADKVYRTRMRLGQKTTTADAEGEVIEEKSVPTLNAEQIEQVLARFRGTIQQVPSMYSALKKDGKPLYELARKGIEVAREPRTVQIYRLELLNVEPLYWELEVACSKGTYIRNLVEDIGDVLGCGAHVAELRRLASGCFQLDEHLTLESLQQIADEQGLAGLDELLLAPWAAIADKPRVTLSDNASYYILHGNPVRVNNLPINEDVLIFDAQNRFLGVGYMNDDGLLAPRRLLKTSY
ncbi:MAG TPA: tRNA pseudouridine(55) synthase TruB [Agitococcus sp.]|uniref:tRNA pseudouridine(55) synthase TruB n=1 Tax=Moraxellaceae TaxID=468 RepID=UPI002610B8D9|nr:MULTISPECIES: tRNA pseudouridine(55) synthase TruB [Moraxellaceae]HMU86210.1 tRNA pseudouridine(55) synthase TruB [Agitococcus sp.]HMV59740.1 tRNA pseudouridine(55) synthase TruB [Agitococcus sp.]HMX99210.1 tRNA pseudouridine(55) synthase TruB [Agitococcus sp.]HMY28242.1 tRNA pseudouridine(55) synthase TruB [Agitococcus sp.]HMY81580.1 tRNA pseudouridine(55) synthase TruB [Agitococcus sp.]